jgi:hypothetical protein
VLSAAHGHSWYGWECCSNEDCAELADGSIEERSDGYLLKSTGELIPLSQAKQGRDEHFHLCRHVIIRCLYTPMRGA